MKHCNIKESIRHPSMHKKMFFYLMAPSKSLQIYLKRRESWSLFLSKFIVMHIHISTFLCIPEEKKVRKVSLTRLCWCYFSCYTFKNDFFSPSLMLFCIYGINSYCLHLLTESPYYFYFLAFIITLERKKLKEFERGGKKCLLKYLNM